ncbi:MAG TPA: hypothetical protein VF646_07675, partial [Cytophagales bacterium]
MPLPVSNLPGRARRLVSWRGTRSLLAELVIVFVGVYGAFLFENYNEARKRNEERQKVYEALRNEIGSLRTTFADIASYQVDYNRELKAKIDRGESPDEVRRLRYVAPQYSLEVLENALRFNSFELLDLPLHIQLSRYHSRVQMLSYAEQKITQLSESYVGLHDASPGALREQYRWSLTYLNDRRDILRMLTTESDKLLRELDRRIQAGK